MSSELPPSSSSISRRQMLSITAAAGVSAAVLPLLEGCSQSKSTSEASPLAGGPMTAAQPVKLNINGKDYSIDIETRVSLLDAIREHIGLTGTKKGCDHGQCGACTILVDGQRVNSCLILAVMAQGKKITTIEGLAQGNELHPIQAAFIKWDAFQCGYCTPGQICSAVGLLNEGKPGSDEEIREQMSGNICRCGAYPNIVKAVKEAASA